MRNPRNKKRKLTVLLTVIILVLAVLMSAFLVLRCLEFDENGAHINDRYGVLAMEGSSGLVDYSQFTSNDKGDDKKTKSNKKADSGEQEKSPVFADEQPEDIRAIVIEAEDLTYDDDYMNQVLNLASQNMIDTVIVDLKDGEGNLNVQISTPVLDTTSIHTVFSDEFPDAVQQLKSAGIRVIGRISSFHDNAAPRTNNSLSCWYGAADTNWLDANNDRWLDPTDPQAVQYLCDIAAKGVEIGCDEILLKDFRFPSGATDLIAFDSSAEWTTVIQEDFAKVKQAAGAVPVGLYIDSSVDDCKDVGQDLEQLYPDAYRIVATLSTVGEENDSTVQTIREMLAGVSKSEGNKLTPLYETRDIWKDSSGAAIYEPYGDIYQLFYLTM